MMPLLLQMREMLAEHARTPFGKDLCPNFFAERPEEMAELFQILFVEYDAGSAAVEPDLRALIRLERRARRHVSLCRTAALKRMDVMHAAYNYPPTCLQKMRIELRGVVHGKEPSELVECLVRNYEDVAKELLARLAIEHRRARLYEMRPGAWFDISAEIDVLHAMVARCTARDALTQILGKK